VTSLHYPANDKGALEVSAEERERELEARYEAGGLNMVGVFTDVMIDPEANEHVAEFFRRKIRERVEDPASRRRSCRARIRGARSARAWTRGTTRRSTAST
jgi:hypothetical protein